MKALDKSTIAIIIAFVLFWNSGFIGAEYALPYAAPFTQLFWRYAGASLIMCIYLIIRQRFQWLPFKKALPQFIIGLLAHGVWLACSLFAIVEGVSAGIVALIVSLQPLATGALEGLSTGQHTSSQQWLGLSMGFVGVAFSILFRMDVSNSTEFLKYLIPLVSVIAITIASLYQRQRMYDDTIKTVPLDLSLFYQALGTTAVLFFPALLIENLSTEWTYDFVITLTWLSIGVSLLAYFFMWMLIERISATRVASLFYLGPPVTMLMGWLMFGDEVKATDLIGLFIIVIGLVFTQVDFKKYIKT